MRPNRAVAAPRLRQAFTSVLDDLRFAFACRVNNHLVERESERQRDTADGEDAGILDPSRFDRTHGPYREPCLHGEPLLAPATKPTRFADPCRQRSGSLSVQGLSLLPTNHVVQNTIEIALDKYQSCE